MKWIIPILVSLLAIAAMIVLRMDMARAATSFSPVPELIHYQARLTDADGISVDDDVNVTLFVYDSPTLGTPGDVTGEHVIYAEDHGSVRVERGMLRLTIGTGGALGPFAGAPLPLENLTIAGGLHVELYIDGERLTPRQSIGFHPRAAYAQYARTADELSGDIHLISSNLPDEIPASKVEGALTVARIPALTPGYLSGAVSAGRVPNDIPLSRISGGMLDGSVIPDIDASKIASGDFESGQLPTTILDEDDVAFAAGIVGNGGSIGIPSGYVSTECAWIVGLANNDTHTVPDGIDDFRIYTGPDIDSFSYDTAVHCEFQHGSNPPVGCDVRYLTVCKH